MPSAQVSHGKPSPSHVAAGSTFCAIASLKLLDAIEDLSIKRKEGLIEWCVQRQVGDDSWLTVCGLVMRW